MTNQPPHGGSGDRPDSSDQPDRPGDQGADRQDQGEYGTQGQYGPGQYGQGQPGPQGAYGRGQAGYGGGPPGSYPPAPPPGGGYSAYPGAVSPATPPSNPLTALFDFGFNRFVTPYVVKFLYILLTVVLAVGYLVVVVAGFSEGIGFGLVTLVGGGIAFLIYLTLARVTLEFSYAVVRMSEDIHHRR